MTQEEHIVLKMERAALDRWGAGDPSGFLEISAKDVVYFDPFQKGRIDGLESLTALYEGLRGMVRVDRYKIINPVVQLCGTAAVLTFNYTGYANGQCQHWNCTEVYRQDKEGWRIIQTHWSQLKDVACSTSQN